MVKFVLFGAGLIGSIHASNITAHPRATLRYVYDVNRAASEQAASRFGAQVASSVEEVWAANDVDAVLIASSTNTHAGLLSSAIKANKPVYCEKPIDVDMERVKAVVQEAAHVDVPIMMGFSRRFDANHLGMREAIQRGEIGKVEMMHLTSRDQEPPPISYINVSGGQFRDQTIHFFDLACWLADEAPLEIYAAGSVLVAPAIGEVGDVDTSMLILRMPGGALCHIDNSRRTTYGYDERIEVFGSDGMVQSRLKPTREVSLYTGPKVISDGVHSSWLNRLAPSFALALDAFISTVEGRKVAYPSLMDGLRAQIIAEAALESLHANQPVKITYWQPE